MQKGIALLLILSLSFVSCKKDSDSNNCERLKNAITVDDKAEALTAINNAISKLPNKEHTSANLSILADYLSSECSIMAEKDCFGCIDTYPEMSHLKVSFNSGGTSFSKYFDIGHNTIDPTMVCKGMH